MAPDMYEEPIESYISEEVWRRELEAVFYRFPLFVGMSSDLAEPGAWFTRDLVGTPLLVTRGNDGRMHAFLNACPHRGVKVTEEPCGTNRRFTCPFHGWVFNPEGDLVGMPFAAGFEGLDRSTKSLGELPSAEVEGMLFVKLSPGPELDMDEFFGDVKTDLADFGFSTWTPIAEPHIHHIARELEDGVRRVLRDLPLPHPAPRHRATRVRQRVGVPGFRPPRPDDDDQQGDRRAARPARRRVVPATGRRAQRQLPRVPEPELLDHRLRPHRDLPGAAGRRSGRDAARSTTRTSGTSRRTRRNARWRSRTSRSRARRSSTTRTST